MSDLKNLNKSELAEQLAASLSGLADSEEKTELQRLGHALQTHQIELEMQNRELREVQFKLEVSRNRYADLYDFAPVGYLTLNTKGCVTEINLTAANMLGIERTNVISQPMTRWLVPECQQGFLNHLDVVFNKKQKAVVELKLKGRNGAVTLDVQFESALAQEGSAIIQCRSAVIDITDRKRYEAQLIIAKEKAEAASQTKSRFLSHMSHELRTPLNAILGFAQVMELSEDDETIGLHRDNLSMIGHAGWHLLRIINNVLDLTAIEANKIDLDIKKVSVAESVQDCIETMSSLAQERRVGLTFNDKIVCDDMSVYADPFRLKQILLNLIDNAVKYNSDGGGVTVHGQKTQAGRVRIAVVDTGPGISVEDIATLFQSFSRLPGQVHAVRGAGVGLSIAKQLAELMDGTIGVESVFGDGSTFWIELPVALESA